MPAQLLRTKLVVPPIRQATVARPWLLERLRAGLSAQLTLISAPAGFGKTTLAAAWLQALERPHAWLSLEPSENDPARFMAYLVAALAGLHPSLGVSAQAMLGGPEPTQTEALLTALINELSALPEPVLLLLDDYHLIASLPVHEALRFLVAHQPSTLHLVIATREDPPLPLARLRAGGHLSEIRLDELRFTLAEAEAFLGGVMGLNLTGDQIATVHDRTEGWAAGLQLAGLQLAALERRGGEELAIGVDTLGGSQRFILDYLAEEVLGLQTPETQDFLLRTALLERLCAPLCDAVLERDDSLAMLRALDGANLFTIPTDGQGQWYRYHHLFADLLRHRLELRSDIDPGELHRRAADWFASQGLLPEAIQHALAAQDWPLASRLIQAASEGLLRAGQMATLESWYAALPEEVVLADPGLALSRAWPLILTEQLDRAEPYVTMGEEIALASGERALLGGVRVAQVHMARVRGDHTAVVALSEESLALLPQDEHSARAVVGINLGLARWFQGRLDEAEQVLRATAEAAERSGNTYAQVASLNFLSRAKVARGEPRQAEAGYHALLSHFGRYSVTCLAHYDLARLNYERNRLAQATEHLDKGLALCELGGSAEFRLAGVSTLALVLQAQGQTGEALERLEQVSSLLASGEISPSTQLYALTLRILVALAQGDIASAERMAHDIPPAERSGSFPDYVSACLARARVLIAQDGTESIAQADSLLAEVQAICSPSGHLYDEIRATALSALSASDPERAQQRLAAALSASETRGYVRTFLDAGPPMQTLLLRHVAEADHQPYAQRLLDAYGEPPIALGASALPTLSAGPLAEPLSARESEVLSLLTQGLTNAEIAQASYLSVNTVKTHLQSIYGKLEVHSRRHAAARARELGLVA